MTDPASGARDDATGLCRAGKAALPTAFGDFTVYAYDGTGCLHHAALVRGEPWAMAVTPVRVHSSCRTGDVFGSLRCDCGAQLHAALACIEREGHGVVVYLDQEGRGIGLPNKIRAYALQDGGLDTVDANRALGFEADHRTYDAAAAILRDLGIDRVRLLTNNPHKVDDLTRLGVRVVERAPLVVAPNPHNRAYLRTKAARLGHDLPGGPAGSEL